MTARRNYIFFENADFSSKLNWVLIPLVISIGLCIYLIPFLFKNMSFGFAGDPKQGFETTRLAQQTTSFLKISMRLRLVTACTSGCSSNHHFSKVFRFLSTFGCVSPIEQWSFQQNTVPIWPRLIPVVVLLKSHFFGPKMHADCVLGHFWKIFEI